jgi:anti-anti-sigma factor
MSLPATFFLRISPPDAHVRAVGELDIAMSPLLDDQLSAAVAAGCSTFTLDLQDVTFCDASTMSVIGNLERTLSATHGSLEIVAASAQVRFALRAFGLDSLISSDDKNLPGSGTT